MTFVAAVAAGASVTDAAAQVGVSRRTALRWHNDPETRLEIDTLGRATLDHARTRLLALVDDAADTLTAHEDPSPRSLTSSSSSESQIGT